MAIFEIQWWHSKELRWRTWRVFSDRMLALDQFKHLQNQKTLWRIVQISKLNNHNEDIEYSNLLF